MNKDLIKTLQEAAVEVEKKTGVPATFQVAQAILESGWDLKPIIDAKTGKNSYNIYGIKYHLGDKNFVSTITTEYENGLKKVVIANFQAYKDFIECFNDHATLLTKEIGFPLTYNDALTQYKKDKNLDLYIARVSNIYATDPEYANYIKGVIKLLPKTEVAVKELTSYEKEIKEAKITMQRLGLITDFTQKEIDVERLAVILNRLIKINFKSI